MLVDINSLTDRQAHPGEAAARPGRRWETAVGRQTASIAWQILREYGTRLLPQVDLKSLKNINNWQSVACY